MKPKIDISQYKEIRKLHSNILNDMVEYFDGGKFEPKALENINGQTKDGQANGPKKTYDWDFDMSSVEKARIFYDIMMYRTRNDMSCITDDFLNKKIYNNRAKNNMLNCMLNTKLGLFDVIEVDNFSSQAVVENVFTGEHYTIVDTGISNNPEFDKAYIYMRIMTYKNMSFNTGLALIFLKENQAINDFIDKNKDTYDIVNELVRYFDLYKLFFKGEGKKVKVITNEY